MIFNLSAQNAKKCGRGRTTDDRGPVKIHSLTRPHRNGNYDAKRAALDLDLLVILISGAPLNHAG
ncbi:hypothetical protein DXU77_23770, partial [Pseudomonas lactis]|nr:hypothetical protein [Pseudomonas lactis]